MEQSTYFDVFLTDVVNLPDSKLEILDERVERIFEALKKADLGTRVIGMTKQGSWAQRTIINPKPGEEFDADFMLELREHANWSPADYQAAVFEALRQYCEAQQMSAPPEAKNRCVRVTYANSMHIDVVPFVDRSDYGECIINAETDEWEDTDPSGFTKWMREKDDITKGNMRRVLRILKYLRDHRDYYEDTKSIILTTIVGNAVTIDATRAHPGCYDNVPSCDRCARAYQGARVFVWGIGGLGSWIAEFIARAGVSSLTICDTGIVTGGLLVRQNYIDSDIGGSKADRLEERLRAIAPGAHIASARVVDDAALQSVVRSADLIVDATINRVVARRLDAVACDSSRRAVIAQVATDAGSSNLGLAMVHGPASSRTISGTDAEVGSKVERTAALEAYRVFWKDPAPNDEFVPTRGCSVPTFHGSAADLAAVAASLTNLIAPHLIDGASGTHLMALPQSGVTPAHWYVPHFDSSGGAAA